MVVEIKLRYIIPAIVFLVLAYAVKSDVYSSSVKINATVGQIISITLSPELGGGIRFGQVSPGTNNNKAIGNSGTPTNYSITITAATSPVNLWHKATGDLSFNTYKIGLGNLTHEANTTQSGENLYNTDGNYPLTTTYEPIGGASTPCHGLNQNDACYLAFWLDVPAGIPSGTYETTYWYCVNATAGNAICE